MFFLTSGSLHPATAPPLWCDLRSVSGFALALLRPRFLRGERQLVAYLHRQKVHPVQIVLPVQITLHRVRSRELREDLRVQLDDRQFSLVHTAEVLHPGLARQCELRIEHLRVFERSVDEQRQIVVMVGRLTGGDLAGRCRTGDH